MLHFNTTVAQNKHFFGLLHFVLASASSFCHLTVHLHEVENLHSPNNNDSFDLSLTHQSYYPRSYTPSAYIIYSILNVSLCCYFTFVFNFLFHRHNSAHGLLKFRHQNILVRVRKRSWFGLKYLFGRH